MNLKRFLYVFCQGLLVLSNVNPCLRVNDYLKLEIFVVVVLFIFFVGRGLLMALLNILT
jgi:hypothetical protein